MVKRLFDFVLAFFGLLCVSPVILVGWIAASVSTRSHGLFMQDRVGLHAKSFKVVKLRSMRAVAGVSTTVTTDQDPRITRVGAFLRKTKIDELPQLFNVLWGTMSFVGPRPDVPGFADRLEGSDRAILYVRPGITGPASLHFRDEERLLAESDTPEQLNREVIWPEKVRLNLEYLASYSLRKDISFIVDTIWPSRPEKR